MSDTELEKATGTLYHAALAITSASNFLRENLPIPPGEKKLIRAAVSEARYALEEIDCVLTDDPFALDPGLLGE